MADRSTHAIAAAGMAAFLVAGGAAWSADYVTKRGGIACTSYEAVIDATVRKITADDDFRRLGCLRIGRGLEVDTIYEKNGMSRIRLYAPDGRRLLMWMPTRDFEPRAKDEE